MPERCFIGDATARYEVRRMRLEDGGPVWEWEPACAHHAEQLADEGHDVRVADHVAVQNPPAWANQGARLDGQTVPTHVLRDRYDAGLSPMQAISYYLSEDPDGPELSRTDTADAIGSQPNQVTRHVSRALEKLED